jgi:hypothetical protein
VKHEDEDRCILMVKVRELVPLVSVRPKRKALCYEKKVIPNLSENKNLSWYVDIDAGYHMTGLQGEIPRATSWLKDW